MKRGSLRAPIPEQTRLELASDAFMSRCIIGTDCDGRIEWHHAMTYAGRRVPDKWAILPMCSKHHGQEASYRQIIQKAIRTRITHFDALAEAADKYPRSSIVQVML